MGPKNPACAKELPRDPPHVMFFKNRYSRSTKVHDWHLWACAEPKDNDVYRDNLSNQLSTYRRWGTDDQGALTTETRVMLEQVYTKKDSIYVYKPLVNFTSYPCAEVGLGVHLSIYLHRDRERDIERGRKRVPTIPESERTGKSELFTCVHVDEAACGTPKRNKLIQKANLEQLPTDFGFMDYMTTQQSDYRNPHPSTVIKPLMMEKTPWLMYRIICSNVTQNHGTAPPRGSYKWLDSHTPIDHVRKLRQIRYKSFDPSTCQQSFPDVQLK